jgi:hypothetical protein
MMATIAGPNTAEKGFVNLTQAAQELHLSVWALRRRIARHDVQTYAGSDGRERLIRRADLARLQATVGIRPYSRDRAN